MTVHDFLDFALAVFAVIGAGTVALIGAALWYGIRLFREMDRMGAVKGDRILHWEDI